MTAYKTIISPETLHKNIHDPDWVIIDTRFSLADTEQGRHKYAEAHIPGAQYAHLDDDLSSPIIPGVTGRHPLPNVAALTQTLGAWGVGAGTQVVVYDDFNGAIAARLWWLLRWLGHEAVAVLDGGWQEWERAGYEVRSAGEEKEKKEEREKEKTFVPNPQADMLIRAPTIIAMRNDKVLVDSRTPERYRGEHEPFDPVAGHIPGAVNAFHGDVVTNGIFRDPQDLAQHFRSILGDAPPQDVAFYCGSGVTACRNILAMTHAGLGMPKLYAGSWSEWITDERRQVAKETE